MILAIVALTVGWVLLNLDILSSRTTVVTLTAGSILFFLILVGVITYLTLSIKTINLTRRQSNFIDSVTHELKSPIASLKLYLQTMEKRELTEDERSQFLDFMRKDVDRLDGLISHLLDARTMEKNVADSNRVEIQLDELVADCAETVCNRYRMPLETIELQLRPAKIMAERVDAMMIFRNLLDNAVKYAGSPAQVHVSMRTERGETIVEVSDNGEGIPIALRRKVFGRFFRIGEELQRKKPGTGLGLYIVRTLVKRIGGRVRILDKDKKWGTVFEVRLPKI
jgi:signal transduction histidine kinase